VVIEATATADHAGLNLNFQQGAVVRNAGSLVTQNPFAITGSLQLASGGQINGPYSLTIGAGGTLSGSGSVNTSLTDNGIIDLSAGQLVFTAPISIGASGIIAGRPAITPLILSNLLGGTQNANLFSPGSILLNGNGSAAFPQLLEAMSQDVGASSSGFANNFGYGTLALGNSTYVQLVDQARNSASAAPEALYADTLIVPAGTTLDLNGLHCYARLARINGTVVNGIVVQAPDGGPNARSSPTPGSISSVGEVDDWTFFARSGQAITVNVNPGSGGTFPAAVGPYLDYADLRLLDSSGKILISDVGSTPGQLVQLSGVIIPADGTYHVQLRAASAQSSSTGTYTVAVWDASVSTTPLPLNQPVSGQVTSPFNINRWTFAASAGQTLNFLITAADPGIAFDLTGPGGWTGFTGVSSTSDIRFVVLPADGTYTVSAYSTNGVSGGAYSFALRQTTQGNLTLGMQFIGSLIGNAQAQLFQVTVPSAQVLSVQLQDSSSADSNELYVKYGSPPSRQDYEFGSFNGGSNQSILVPSAAPGIWYVLVYAASVPSVSSYTLLATTGSVQLTQVSPDHYATGTPASLTIAGAGFTGGTTVSLIGSNTTYAPTSVSIDSFTQITATFSLAALFPQSYTLKVTRPDGSSAELTDGFTVLPAGQAQLQTRLIVPAALGRHSSSTFYVEYSNVGTAAMPAPLILLESSQSENRPLFTLDPSRIVPGYWTSAIPAGYSNTVEFLASGTTAGVLEPGESFKVPVYYAGVQAPYSADSSFNFDLRYFTTSDADPIDWSSMQASLQPPGINPTAWGAIYANLAAQTGTTWGNFVQTLDNNAVYLSRLAQGFAQPNVRIAGVGAHTDVSKLWALSFLRADGLGPIEPLASRTDASLPAPGLSLSFSRAFAEPIASRYNLGPLGFGWSSPWFTSLHVEADGTVKLNDGTGMMHEYQPDSRLVPLLSGGFNTRYFDQAGDYSNLIKAADGSFILTAPNGQVTGYRADGKLDYVADTNGNKITAAFDGAGHMIGLTHSSGQSLAFTYNNLGLISSVTDSDGRATTYSYDSNKQLMELDSALGTIRYTYSNGAGAATEHALTSVQNIDGTHEYFTYDSFGRLTSTSRDGGAEQINLSYNQPGEVTVTDANGNSAELFYNEKNELAKTVDPLGNLTSFAYDGNFNLMSITDATGQTQSFAYDLLGNLTSDTDQLHHTTTFAYGARSRLRACKEIT
jgi:YD repeat-containing protein